MRIKNIKNTVKWVLGHIASLRMLRLREKNQFCYPKWFAGLILGTINPLTISIGAENQLVYSFRRQS